MAKIKMKVTGGSLNVRKGPSKEDEIIRVLKDHEEVEVLEMCGEWCRLEDGYAMAAFMRPVETKAPADKSTTEKKTAPAKKKAAAKKPVQK